MPASNTYYILLCIYFQPAHLHMQPHQRPFSFFSFFPFLSFPFLFFFPFPLHAADSCGGEKSVMAAFVVYIYVYMYILIAWISYSLSILYIFSISIFSSFFKGGRGGRCLQNVGIFFIFFQHTFFSMSIFFAFFFLAKNGTPLSPAPSLTPIPLTVFHPFSSPFPPSPPPSFNTSFVSPFHPLISPSLPFTPAPFPFVFSKPFPSPTPPLPPNSSPSPRSRP